MTYIDKHCQYIGMLEGHYYPTQIIQVRPRKTWAGTRQKNAAPLNSNVDTTNVAKSGRLDKHIYYAYIWLMDFEWDPAKARSNLAEHGVGFSDVETAFYDQHAISMPDPGASAEERFILVGMDALGKIVVVYTYRGNSIRLISARKATKSERKSYEEGIRF